MPHWSLVPAPDRPRETLTSGPARVTYLTKAAGLSRRIEPNCTPALNSVMQCLRSTRGRP